MNPSALTVYINWLTEQLETKAWGKVTLSFTVCNGQVTLVSKESVDTEQIPLAPKK